MSKKESSDRSLWLQDLFEHHLNRLGRRLGLAPEQSKALVTFAQPTLRSSSGRPLGPFFEPLLAVLALSAMLAFAIVGVYHFMVFSVMGALIYLILNKIFGIELDMATPLG